MDAPYFLILERLDMDVKIAASAGLASHARSRTVQLAGHT
jgi:hypothetical protein